MASQNVPQFTWVVNSIEAAELLAEGRLTQEQVAEKIGVSRRTITRWLNVPEFKSKVEEIRDKIEARILNQGIARKAKRIERLQDRCDRMQRVMEERGADSSMADVPGGPSGLLVHRIKSVGSGDNATIVHEYEIDAALLREAREAEKQAAIEMGQWTEKRDVTSGGVPFKVYLGVDVEAV